MIPVETANQIVDLWNGAATIGNGGSLPLGDDGCKLVISTKRWTLKCDTYDLCLSGRVVCITDHGGRLEFSLATGTELNDDIMSFSVKVGA